MVGGRRQTRKSSPDWEPRSHRRGDDDDRTVLWREGMSDAIWRWWPGGAAAQHGLSIVREKGGPDGLGLPDARRAVCGCIWPNQPDNSDFSTSYLLRQAARSRSQENT